MKAVAFHEFGPPEVLRLEQWADPAPGPGEVVVQVKAVSIGRLLDLGTRAGRNPYFTGKLPHILGAEHAGVAVATGPGVTEPRAGERVAVFAAISCGGCRFCLAGQDDACPKMDLIGVHRQGAYAEYSRVPAVNCSRIPEGISDFEATAMALSGPVAWMQLCEAGVKQGTWVLVHAAGSALNSMVVLVALHLGARVIGTSRQEWKRRELEKLGLAAALDSYAEDFPQQVRELTQGEGVDVVVNNIGAAADWPNLVAGLARRGVVVSSGAFLGDKVPLDLRPFYQQSQRLLGFKTANRAAVAAFWNEVRRGGIRPLLDRTFPLADASQAHAYMEGERQLGRVALTN